MFDFDFDFDIDWKSAAIGAGAVAAVIGAAYGISKLCEDDDCGSSSSSSLPKMKTPEEVLSNVDLMNEIINSGMPLDLAMKIANEFNFNIPNCIGRTASLMIIFNSNNDRMINALVGEYNKWKEYSEGGNNKATKEDLDLMEEIINSNMPASLIKEAAESVSMKFTEAETRKIMIQSMFLCSETTTEALKNQYMKWKNGEFKEKTSEAPTENKENNSEVKAPESKESENK